MKASSPTVTSHLETTVDKFTFRVATDRFYSQEGIWAKAEGSRVRVGLSDFLQQRSGDVAFAEVQPVGRELQTGDELAVIETIKVNISLASPVAGTIVAVNPVLENAPEIINSDPYGEGWVAVIEAPQWQADQARLLEPQAYFEVMRSEAEEASKKR